MADKLKLDGRFQVDVVPNAQAWEPLWKINGVHSNNDSDCPSNLPVVHALVYEDVAEVSVVADELTAHNLLALAVATEILARYWVVTTMSYRWVELPQPIANGGVTVECIVANRLAPDALSALATVVRAHQEYLFHVHLARISEDLEQAKSVCIEHRKRLGIWK